MQMIKQLNRLKLSYDEVLAEACRRSFYLFVQTFWDVIIQEPPVYNWHIKYLCDELQYLNSFVVRREPKPYDLIINVPPGSSKSTIITQMYNAWVWTIDPSQRFISASYAAALSISQSVKTRDIVTSDLYRRLFPDVQLKADSAGKTDYSNTRGGQRFTTSTGGTVTGMHAHQILIDDPINPKEASSDKEREAANEFVTNTLASRKIDKAITPTILVMQRLHESDPTGVMLSKKNKRIKHICLPAEITHSWTPNPAELAENYVNGLLDPVRMSREVLDEQREDLGSFGYAGQFGQSPTPDGGGMFKKDWFEIIDWSPNFAGLVWHIVADTAYTAKEKNDPSGFIAYTELMGEYIIRDAESLNLEFPELVKHLPAYAARNGAGPRSRIEIEPKASGKSLVQTLKRHTRLNVVEGVPPAKDKISRAKDASPVCEARRVKLIRGAWNKAFVEQVCTFPNATHDEYVDLLSMIINRDNRPKKRGVKVAN